jgi:nucleotide-binding universal stress UspA family protein
VIFDRVICGVDASEESLEAVRQAARIVSGSGRLLLVAVVEVESAVHAGWAAATVIDQLKEEAEAALERAHREISHLRLAETSLLEGPAAARLLEKVELEKAGLLCIGTHGHHRIAGILIGSLTTTFLHDAPCSVLIARASKEPGAFPSSITVGLDGSPQSEAALAVAEALRERFGASIHPIVAAGGKGVDPDAIREKHAEVEVAAGKPVDVLVRASADRDLLVVGSRGVHGVKALGSVSERAAHSARCSVLVVR